MSIIPVPSSIKSVFFHVLPPSFVTYTPLFLFLEYRCPVTPTIAWSLLVGLIKIFPIW